MKKIIVLLLSFLIAFTAAFNVSVVAKSDVYFEEALGLLSVIGVLDENDTADFNSGKSISRAEFVRIINKINNISVDSGEELPYWDVADENEYYNDIAIALKSGVVDGEKGDSFRPHNTVTYAEAVKMISVVLGYKKYAVAKGGYPYGYLLTAQEGGYEIKGYSYLQELNYGDMVNLIFKAITMPVLMQTVFGNDIDYSNKEGLTLLKLKFDMYKVSGIVTANDVANLVYGNKYIDGGFKIDETTYFSCDTDYRKMLGHYVNCYYKDEDGRNIIVYMHKNKKDVSEIFKGEDVKGVANDSFVYTVGEDKKERTLKISVLTKFLYNGKAINYETEYSDSLFDIDCGYVECIDNDGDDIYDVISITKWTNVVAEAVNTDLGFVSGKYNVGEIFDLSEDVVYEISDLYGKTYSLEDIKSGVSLMMAVSFDKKYVRILYCDEFVEGIISACTAEGEVIINGKTYDVSREYIKTNSIFVGKPGLCYLNAYGELTDIKYIDETGASFGLLTGVNSVGAFSDDVSIVVMPTNGDEEIEYILTDRVLIDEKNFTGLKKISDYLNPQSKENINEGIRYWVNEDKQIYKIDTPTVGNEQAGETLIKRWSFDDAALSYKAATGIFGRKFFSDPHTTVLYGIGAAAEGDKEEVECYTPSQVLSDDKSCVCELYTIGYDSMDVVGIVMKNSALHSTASAVLPESDIYVYEKCTMGMDEDGYAIGIVTYYSAETKMTAYIDVKDKHLIDGYNCGDVFILRLDSKQYIRPSKIEGGCNIMKIYDYKAKTFTQAELGQGISHGYGTVYKKVGSNVRFGEANLDYNNMTHKERDTKLSTAPIGGFYGCTLYEIVNGKLKAVVATADNISDYASSGEFADTVVYQTSYGHNRRFCYIKSQNTEKEYNK